MSKILDAYHKRSGGAPDLAFELARTSRVALYPTPSASQLAEFGELANMMLRLQTGARGLVLGMGSTTAGEGGSYVSYHAALLLAQTLGKRVVWIDANYKSPQRKLQTELGPTFADILEDPSRIADVASDQGLTLVPGGRNLAQRAGVLASEAYRDLLDTFRERFHFTVIDLPPLLDTMETALLAKPTDGVLVVIESKRLKWEIIKHGIEGLQEKSVNVLGTIINRREYELPKIIYDRL